MSLGDRIVQLIQAQAAPLAQARAMQGQIAGDTIRGIGQTFAAVPGQIQATKIAQQDQKMRQLQIDAAERDAKSIKAYGAALSDPANLNEDGTINDTKVGDYLRKADIGAYDKWTALSAARSKAALEAKKDLAAIQASQATTEEKQQALQKTRGDYLGRIAYSGLNMLAEKPDDPLHARDTFLAAIAHAASPSVPGAPPAIDQKQAQELILRTAGADRSQLAQMFTSVIPPDLKAKLDKEQADIAKTNADAAKTAVEARNIELYGSATPPTAQSEKWRVKGVGDVPLQFMPGKKPGDSGHYYLTTADGKQVEKIPGRDFTAIPTAAQFNLSGANAVKELPEWALNANRPLPADGNVFNADVGMTPNGLFQAAINYIDTGKYPRTSMRGDKQSNAQKAAITSKVGAIAADAGMDIPELQAFYAANKSSLTAQQKAYDTAMISITKADRDADLLQKMLDKVPDTGSPLFNQGLRAFEKNVAGDKDMAEFATRLRSVANEYTRLLNANATGGGSSVVSDSARHEIDELLSDKATVGQMIRSIAALKSEGGNRLLSQGEQIKNIRDRMHNQAGGDVRQKAADVLSKGGYASDAKAVDVFLKNNPGFK